jgi:hypothetical protein
MRLGNSNLAQLMVGEMWVESPWHDSQGRDPKGTVSLHGMPWNLRRTGSETRRAAHAQTDARRFLVAEAIRSTKE